MDRFFWIFKTRDGFNIAWPLLLNAFFAFLIVHSDFIGLLIGWYWRMFRGTGDGFVARRPGERPGALVIIPSLLRDRDDLKAITTTVHSCGTNGYPGELVVIASVDGRAEEPELYEELCGWIARQSFPDNVHVYVGGREKRLGKGMAVDAGVELMKELVRHGSYAAFPPIYFSVDGDGTLGANALERLVDRLTTPHRFSGNPRRVVSSKPCIRPELFWQGWTWQSFRSFFTIEGQIYRQVAREFVFSNIARFNLRLKPQITIPGGLYCCWSEILIQAPRFMGFLRTIRLRDWLRWWLGFGPPKFSESVAPPLPEALTGPSDDTCISFLAGMASWKNGKLSLDAPRTPLHAFGRLVKGYFWERSPDYAPEGRVYTYTPTTLKGLWVQRVRWNASRYECAYRFKSALVFHWEVGAAVASDFFFILPRILTVAFYYWFLPYYVLCTRSGAIVFFVGYALQVATVAIYTWLALLIERERDQFWPVLFGAPLAPLHSAFINLLAAFTGVTKDLFLFGNTTKFAPEWTFKKGRTERIALLFRVRRFLSLCVRAVVVGDVPWGAFWFGWHETPWTPSGYHGWTTGEEQRIVPPVAAWFGGRLTGRGGAAAPRSREPPSR